MILEAIREHIRRMAALHTAQSPGLAPESPGTIV
jgi:hypothetical protein